VVPHGAEQAALGDIMIRRAVIFGISWVFYGAALLLHHTLNVIVAAVIWGVNDLGRELGLALDPAVSDGRRSAQGDSHISAATHRAGAPAP